MLLCTWCLLPSGPKSYEKIQGSMNKYYRALLPCPGGCCGYLEEQPHHCHDLSSPYLCKQASLSPSVHAAFPATVSQVGGLGTRLDSCYGLLSLPPHLALPSSKEEGPELVEDLISPPLPLHSLKHPFICCLVCLFLSL